MSCFEIECNSVDLECFNRPGKNIILEKVLLVGCYYSFGLVGLLTIIIDFISQIESSKKLIVHTLQALLAGVFISVATMFIAFLKWFMPLLNLYLEIIGSLNSLWPFVVFILISLICFKAIIIKKFAFKTTCKVLHYLN